MKTTVRELRQWLKRPPFNNLVGLRVTRVAKDGVTMQALYSKLIELWDSATSAPIRCSAMTKPERCGLSSMSRTVTSDPSTIAAAVILDPARPIYDKARLYADAFVAYRTNPHVDMAARAARELRDGFYVNLGIGGYSEVSHAKVVKFAETVAAPLGAVLHVHTVEQEAGAGIKELAMLIHRPTCSTCGTIKRYQFNRVALEHKYDVMATGHNLDDEAARLLGRVETQSLVEHVTKLAPKLIEEVVGEPPLLLLDDVLAELDLNRQNQLLETIQERFQTLITTTHLGAFDAHWLRQTQILSVEAGQIRRF